MVIANFFQTPLQVYLIDWTGSGHNILIPNLKLNYRFREEKSSGGEIEKRRVWEGEIEDVHPCGNPREACGGCDSVERRWRQRCHSREATNPWCGYLWDVDMMEILADNDWVLGNGDGVKGMRCWRYLFLKWTPKITHFSHDHEACKWTWFLEHIQFPYKVEVIGASNTRFV